MLNEEGARRCGTTSAPASSLGAPLSLSFQGSVPVVVPVASELSKSWKGIETPSEMRPSGEQPSPASKLAPPSPSTKQAKFEEGGLTADFNDK